MDGGLSHILAFVEGRITPREFEQIVYNDPAVERAVADDPDRNLRSYVGRSLYHFIIAQDFGDPGGVLTVQGALQEFLVRKGIENTPTESYAERYDLLLGSQPSWLSVDTKYIETKLVPEAGGLSGKALQRWLKDRLRKEFKYACKPPKWIQSPRWPIGPNGPLVFLGQFALRDYFHDEAAVYVFHDPATGTSEVIIQVA